jgi:hypothetical protein
MAKTESQKPQNVSPKKDNKKITRGKAKVKKSEIKVPKVKDEKPKAMVDRKGPSKTQINLFRKHGIHFDGSVSSFIKAMAQYKPIRKEILKRTH